MEQLFDKLAFLLLPKNFAAIFPYCFWYWVMFTLILVYIYKKK